MGKAKNRYNIMNGIELTRRRNQNGSRIYLSTAIGSDVVCGLWMGLCTWAASGMLVGWTGFVGCTAYFASGGSRGGFIRSVCSNYAGVAIGSAILSLGNLSSNGPIFSALCSGFFTGVICYLAH